MANSDNSLKPSVASVSLSTASLAVKLNTATLQVQLFSVSNPNANALYLGDSNVSSSRYLAKITAGSTYTVGPIKISQNQTQALDLTNFYIRATSTSGTYNLTTYLKVGTGGAY